MWVCNNIYPILLCLAKKGQLGDVTVEPVGGCAPRSPAQIWPLRALFCLQWGMWSYKPSSSGAPESWPDALWPGLGEMPAPSLRPPLLLTFDAAFHLWSCWHLFLMLPSMHSPTAPVTKAIPALVAAAASLGWALAGTVGLQLSPPRAEQEAISLPLSTREGKVPVRPL